MAKRGETRKRLLETTASLLQTQGLNGTGLLQVLKESGAPRGSLYFHFPGGKEELTAEAAELAGSAVRGWIERAASVEDLFERYARRLERSGFREGCPVAAVALEGAPISDRLRQAAAGAFDSWTAALAARLEKEGHTREVAEGLAVTILCALEGALVLARAQRSAEPVRAVSRGLAPLLRPV